MTYSSNWSTQPNPTAPEWFTRLDTLGIDAWFPAYGLTDEATSAEIATALSEWTDELRAFAAIHPTVPLIVTEVGITSQAAEPSVLQRPWHWPDQELPPAPDMQARYIEGACHFYRQLLNEQGAPLVSGLFWWTTSVIPLADPLADRSFEFIGKPAASIIGDCFAM